MHAYAPPGALALRAQDADPCLPGSACGGTTRPCAVLVLSMRAAIAARPDQQARVTEVSNRDVDPGS